MNKPGSGRGASRSGRAASSRSAAAHKQPHRKRPDKAKIVFDAPVPVVEKRIFRLAIVPGATPGKWISLWRERMPDVPLEVVHVSARGGDKVLLNDEADAALLRPPHDTIDLRSFHLYDEVPVVVISVDSALTAGDELSAADLAGEVVIVAQDDVLRLGNIEGTIAPVFDAPASAQDAIATVATGVGVTIVPMSIARKHHRKDVEYRPYLDAPASPVVLAWHADRETADVQTFIGIVRGRTANSSRG